MSNEYPPAGYGQLPPVPPQHSPARKSSREGKNPTRRVLSTQRKIFLAFAVIAALLVVLATMRPEDKDYVARFASQVPAMGELTDTQLEVVEIDPAAIEPGAVSGQTQAAVLADAAALIEGKKARAAIFPGQQLRPEMVTETVPLATPLTPDERLVSVSARAGGSVAGTIVPGDRVDVYVATDEGLAGLLASNVEIVAVTIRPDQLESVASTQLNEPDKAVSDLVPARPLPGTYVIRIPGDLVAKFIASDASAALYLALRGLDATDTEATPMNVRTAICADFPEDPVCLQ